MKTKPSKKVQFRQRLMIAGGAILVLLVVVVGLLWSLRTSQHAKTAATPTISSIPTATSNDATSNDGAGKSPSPQAAPTAAPSAAPSSAPIAAPLLSKSSGNNGPVPAGAAIEFVCKTTSKQSCNVSLTNAGGTVVNLGAKSTQDDGRGVFGATWNWKAVGGTWTITATATQGTAQASSDKQTITVQ